MTVLTKPSLTIKKIPLIDENRCDEEIIEMHTSSASKRHGVAAILCMGVTVFLLVLMGVITALQIYEQVTTDVAQHTHYQGFCSIPLSKDFQMLETQRIPLRWKSTKKNGYTQVEPEVEVLSNVGTVPDPLVDLLREMLDIDIDDSTVKISVINNGHPVSFIHDFESNITGIVDEERCFAMELDSSLVLQPEQFVFGLQRGDDFDVSRVRSSLRVELPPPPARAPPAARALQACQGKPVYQLHKTNAVIIRKREVDAPPHDYMQFAGNRIQEIEISNLAELLEYEQDNKPAV